MKRILGMAGALALAACSTQAPETPQASASVVSDQTAAGEARPGPAAQSCPERTDILFRPPLPEEGFVPAPAPGSTLAKPQRLHSAAPDYPAASRRCREAGTVTITYCVGADGKVENVQVTESSGFARLDNAVLAWAARDRHVAGTVNGKPTRYCGLHIEQTFDAPAPADAAHT
ncbi:MAG TPA: energy transducer TonB [Hyphomonadaceae bacterium]|nr:energy transducer TonB [Hyphomonadaceae bacterium]